MKKQYLTSLIVLCSMIFSSLAQERNEKKFESKGSTVLYMGKYDPKLLEGFDEAVARKKTSQRSIRPEEQQEYFELLKRQYFASKQPAPIAVHGNQQYNSSYNASTKALNINLTPYSSYCPNTDFGNANFSNWVGYTYTNSAAAAWNSFTPSWVPGIMTTGNNNPNQAHWPVVTNPYPNRHTIMTIPPTQNTPPTCIGWDSIAINPVTHLSEIPFVPPTANGVTCRLGNANNDYNETEKIVYTVNVSPQNTQFSYSYALIIEDGGHQPEEQAFFKVSINDQAGNPINGSCGSFSINATQAITDPTFTKAAVDSAGVWVSSTNTALFHYKKWSTTSVDLSAYIGQNITIEFQTADCIYGAHFCYAYIDASCEPLQATMNYCSGSSTAFCVAPTDYNTYQWYGPNNMNPIAGATNDTLVIVSPVIGDIYTVSVASSSGCVSTIQITVQNTSIGVQGISSTPSCSSSTTGAATIIPTGSTNGYTYQWTGPSGPIAGNSSTISNLSVGTYSVHIASIGCGYKDTVVTVGIAPPNFQVSTQYFCANPLVINAPMGSSYLWYDANLNLVPGSSGANPLSVANNGNTNYTVSYTNSSGCRDSLRIQVSEHGNYSTQNVNVCGNTAVLNVMAGATNINWYNNIAPYAVLGHGQSISINHPFYAMWQGYPVSYINPNNGCKDSIQFFITATTGSITTSNYQGFCANPVANGQIKLNFNFISQTSGLYTYTISGPAGYNNVISTTAPVQLTNLAQGTYSVAVNFGACVFNDEFTIHPLSPNVHFTYNSNVLCGNDTSFLSIDTSNFVPTSCQSTPGASINTGVIQVGTATSQNTSTSYPTTYGNWHSNEKYQILYTAADLQAAGVSAGGLSSIGFNVLSIQGMATGFDNYSIKIACTNTNDLGTFEYGYSGPFVVSPFVTVYGPQHYFVSQGWNTHNFAQPYAWDGVSNIIVEICYDYAYPNSSTTCNAIMANTSTSYNCFAESGSYSTLSCPDTIIQFSFAQRPVTKFGTCSLTNPNNYTYQWAPATGLSTTTGISTVATPTVTTTYTLTSTSTTGGCNGSDTVTVYVNQIPQPTITQNGNVMTASQGTAYQWLMNNVVIVGATAQNYTVTQSDTFSVIVTYGSCGFDTSAGRVMNVTGIQNYISQVDFVLYPNPAQREVNINADIAENAMISLMDITGQTVCSVKTISRQNNYKLNLTGVSPGLYFVRLIDAKGGYKVQKLIVE